MFTYNINIGRWYVLYVSYILGKFSKNGLKLCHDESSSFKVLGVCLQIYEFSMVFFFQGRLKRRRLWRMLSANLIQLELLVLRYCIAKSILSNLIFVGKCTRTRPPAFTGKYKYFREVQCFRLHQNKFVNIFCSCLVWWS